MTPEAAKPEEAVESPFSGDRAPLPPRVDLYTAAVLLTFGLGIMALSWRMPTFVEQSHSGLTAPGIVPGFHGTLIALLAILLGLRAVRRGALAEQTAHGRAIEPADARQLLMATVLGTLYAGFLVGTLPFWAASAVFVFAFVTAFEWEQGPARRVRRMLEAGAIALGTGYAVTLVFERVFLVRLP